MFGGRGRGTPGRFRRPSSWEGSGPRTGPRAVAERKARGSWFGQVSVDGGTGDAEFPGDLLDGMGAFALGVLLLVHLAGQFDLARSELGFLPAVKDVYEAMEIDEDFFD